MTTKLPLTDERLSTISDYFVAMEEHYSDPADRENFEIFSDAKAFLAELQQRRKAATGREPVGIKLPPKMSNDRINAHELSTGVDVWHRCIDEVAKLNGKCIPSVPSGLHPDTQKLVTNFCTALAEKLYKAQLKYGHSDNWSYANWEIECQTAFHEHIAKGDPRDVAAYCAFMWYHGWRTEVERREQVVPDEVEHVAAVLELIGGFEAADIDSDTVDLRFEIDDVDTGSDVSITEYAARGSAIIRMLAGNALVNPDSCILEALENIQTENEVARDQLVILQLKLLKQQRKIAELESRTVKLPKPKDSGPGWKIDPEFISKVQNAIGYDDKCECWEGTPSMEVVEAVLLAAAGIKVEAE